MTFTMTQGYAVSLALHGALLLPFVAAMDKPTISPSLLVVELQGPTGETQSEAEIQRETRGAPEQQSSGQNPPGPTTQGLQSPAPPERKQAEAIEQQAARPPPTGDEPAPQQAPDRAAQAEPRVSKEAARPDIQNPARVPARAPQPAPGSPGRADVKGADDPSQGQTLADAQRDADRLRAYSALLSKKVQRNLAYPDAGRKEGLQGMARVAFALDANGGIRPGSLRVAESSGQPALDASALKTVRNSEPFDPPPHPISIVIAVNYGRRK